MSSKDFIGPCSNPTLYAMPALLTRTSSPWYLSSRYCCSFSMLLTEVISSWWKEGFRPSLTNLSHASLPRCSSLAVQKKNISRLIYHNKTLVWWVVNPKQKNTMLGSFAHCCIVVMTQAPDA